MPSLVAHVEFGILRAHPSLSGLPHIADFISSLLDVAPAISLETAIATGSTRLVDRVLFHLQKTQQIEPELFSHLLARGLLRAIKKNNVAIAQKIHDIHPEPLDAQTLAVGLQYGTLDTVQWVVANRHDSICCEPGLENLCASCLNASLTNTAMFDKTHVVPWLFHAGFKFGLTRPKYEDARMIRDVVRDDLSLVKWLYEQKFISTINARYILTDTIQHGPSDRVDIVRFLFESGVRVDERTAISVITKASVRADLEPILEVVIASHLCDSFRDKFTYAATREGGPKVLQWDEDFMLTNKVTATKRIKEYLVANATYHWHIDLVRWLIEKRGIVPELMSNPGVMPPYRAINDQEVLALYELLHSHGVNVFDSLVLEEAASYGRIDVIQWMCANNKAVIDSVLIDYAAKGGQLDTIRWLHDNRIGSCTSKAMEHAAKAGRLDILHWLKDNRGEFCEPHCLDQAARDGNLEIVQWLTAHTDTGDTTSAMANAAWHGHIDVLAWLHENRSDGCIRCALRYAFSYLSITSYTDGHYFGRRLSLRWLRSREPGTARCGDDCELLHSVTARMAISRGDLPLLRDFVSHYRESVRVELSSVANSPKHDGILRYLRDEFPARRDWRHQN